MTEMEDELDFPKTMEDRIQILQKQPRPMNEEQFADIELYLRSLRTHKPAPEDEFVVVGFETVYNQLLFIQAMSVESFRKCRVEIGLERKGKSFPQIYAKNSVPIDTVVSIFRDVCCSTNNPDFSEWIDDTYNIMKAKEIEDK